MTLHYKTSQGLQRTYKTHFEGVIPNLQRRYREASSDYAKREIERYMAERDCPVCQGRRLKPEALAVTVADKADRRGHRACRSPRCCAGSRNCEARPECDSEVRTQATEGDALLTRRQRTIARQILKELHDRLSFMANVGLDYLTIDRRAATLSGGEAQRIRLATQIGSRLMGVLYILDEPSIGLHPRDNGRLIHTLLGMRDLGNTVIVVEHDEETMRAADWILDLGPGAGEHGGEVVCSAPLDDVPAVRRVADGRLPARASGKIAMPEVRRPGDGKFLTVTGAPRTT